MEIWIPRGYEQMAKAGYPIGTIFAIDRLEQSRNDTNRKIAVLSKIQRLMESMGYKEPFFTWWPWDAPKGHPDGSLWLLSRYAREASETLQGRLDALAVAIDHSKLSLESIHVANASVNQVVMAEANLQGQIYGEDLSLKKKYTRLAQEVGAQLPWEMLSEKGISDAIRAMRMSGARNR